jgi:hypothetical protein
VRSSPASRLLSIDAAFFGSSTATDEIRLLRAPPRCPSPKPFA